MAAELAIAALLSLSALLHQSSGSGELITAAAHRTTTAIMNETIRLARPVGVRAETQPDPLPSCSRRSTGSAPVKHSLLQEKGGDVIAAHYLCRCRVTVGWPTKGHGQWRFASSAKDAFAASYSGRRSLSPTTLIVLACFVVAVEPCRAPLRPGAGESARAGLPCCFGHKQQRRAKRPALLRN